MGRGSTNCIKLTLKIVEHPQNNVLQQIFNKTLKISSPIVHISSNKIIWRNLFTGQGWSQYWMLMIGPLVSPAWRQVWSCFGYHCMGSGTLPQIVVCEPVHHATHRFWLKLYHAKKAHLLRTTAPLTWTEAKWTTLLWSDKNNIQ